MIENRTCPGCRRHCDLSEPQCERGAEYLSTGKLPERTHEDGYRNAHEDGHRHAHEDGYRNAHEDDHRHAHEDGHRHAHCDAHHRRNGMEHYDSAGMNDKLIINLRDISHMMRGQYEGKASQKRILIILHESDALTQKELTERLGIQPGSASEILSKLENAGLIVRTANEADRRTTDIRLTDAGVKLALEASAQRQKRHQEMFSCLTAEERQTLLVLLEKLHADWESRFEGHHDHGEHHGGRHHGAHPHHDR